MDISKVSYGVADTSVVMDSFEQEIKTDFINEARELLSGTERCFLNLEKNPADQENINSIFRLAHNLKGSAKAVGFTELSEFTHELESLLLALKEGRIHATKHIVDLLLRTNDYLIHTIETLQGDLEAAYANPELKKELIHALQTRGEAVTTEDLPKPVPERESASGPREASDAMKDSYPFVHEPKFQTAPGTPVLGRPKDESIRVSLHRIEKILNNVGELSILQAVMVQQGHELGSNVSQLMRETLSSMTKIIRETQTLSMGLRMIPVKQTFQKMERIVRDTSKALGKKVDFHLSGEETEIDKIVLEQLADPLVHIVRNAVDHGLEDLDGRKAVGKSETGNVSLSAYHRAGQIVIELRDDGKGIDAEKLVAKAKEKGILAPDIDLTQEQAYQLIFAPGFSTKDEVTDVSGRGVGMDVVKTNIVALQGNIEIETAIGKGTCFRIFLPLTLAIIDSVIIRLDEERYVIPLSQVSEFFRPRESDINRVYDRSEILTLRDEPLQVSRLSSLLGTNRDSKQSKAAWNLTALIVRDGSNRAVAILVDRVVSQQQVVIKPLGAEVKGKPGVMGSAILGDGKPSLILDLFELMRSKLKSKLNKGMEAA